MAWCENEHCKKNGLRKADVEFCETTHKVLCHGCYVLVHQGWMPPSEIVDLTEPFCEAPRIGFAFELSDSEGLKAMITYGKASITIQAPPSEMLHLLG